jgi:hypothetical protein
VLQPPKIHFEFVRWTVEVLKGKSDRDAFSPGERFSLGRIGIGSGCYIGMIVETRMGNGISVGGKEGEIRNGVDVENGLGDL